jgi:hypothetical protein
VCVGRMGRFGLRKGGGTRSTTWTAETRWGQWASGTARTSSDHSDVGPVGLRDGLMPVRFVFLRTVDAIRPPDCCSCLATLVTFRSAVPFAPTVVTG